jgi:hypothetical protein
MHTPHTRLGRWWHDTFHDVFFRSLIGPAQTRGAIQGSSQEARDQWKRDLEHRKQYTHEQHERKHHPA